MRSGLWLALALAACAREAPTTTHTVAARAEARAKALVDCFLTGDFRPMADMTLPVVVEGMGGAEAMAKRISEGTKKGPKVVAARVSTATVHRRGDTIYGFVPFTLEFGGLLGTQAQESWLLGVSRDEGRTWHFLDGITLTRDKLLRVLPDFPADLELPKKR
jgi:hypothetical protein